MAGRTLSSQPFLNSAHRFLFTNKSSTEVLIHSNFKRLLNQRSILLWLFRATIIFRLILRMVTGKGYSEKTGLINHSDYIGHFIVSSGKHIVAIGPILEIQENGYSKV